MPLASLVILIGAAACRTEVANDRFLLGNDSGPMCMAPLLCGLVAPSAFLAAGATSGTLPDTAAEDEEGAAAGPEGGGDIAGIPPISGGASGTEPPDAGGEGVPYPQDGELVGRFLAGYQAANGPAEYRAHIIAVIECESRWQIDPGNPDYRGLAQFTPRTWASYSRFGQDTDWRDPWEQGWTTANLVGDLLERGISPGSSAGWPVCWNVVQ